MSILIIDECTLVSSDDFEDEEDCIEEKLEGYCQDIDNHDTTACKCASSRSKKKGLNVFLAFNFWFCNFGFWHYQDIL